MEIYIAITGFPQQSRYDDFYAGVDFSAFLNFQEAVRFLDPKTEHRPIPYYIDEYNLAFKDGWKVGDYYIVRRRLNSEK